MRFADSLLRLVLSAALAAAASGCAMFAGPPASKSAQPAAPAGAAIPAKTQATANAATQSSAPAQAGVAAPKGESEPPLSPAVQQAFETARRALIAKRFDEAERGFLALTKSNPELGGPHANLAIVYRHAGKLPESVASLERAVQANPREPVLYNQLGIAYRMVGQFAKSRDGYDKAIALDPNYALPYLNLGILYDVYLGDSERAVAQYDRYLALSPGGDDKVKKWVSDIRKRNPQKSLASRKEQE